MTNRFADQSSRVDYEGEPLDEGSVAADPFEQFRRWFDEVARAGRELVPNGMVLATATADGRPSARVVLLKDLDARGFVFFTNYRSRKGRELAENPRGALCFWWESVHRQVRIEGAIERVEPEVSDAYFATRPRASGIAAMASPQSEPLPDRAALEARVAEVARTWEGRELVRPEYWGGYRLVPEWFEFWQGRPNRLHDRLAYEKDPAAPVGWRIRRLAP